MINIKERKRIRHAKLYKRFELCLCIEEGGLFNTVQEFNFVIESDVLDTIGFSRIFLITVSNLFVIENKNIKEYKRKI